MEKLLQKVDDTAKQMDDMLANEITNLKGLTGISLLDDSVAMQAITTLREGGYSPYEVCRVLQDEMIWNQVDLE